MKCLSCKTKIPEGKTKCPACGKWNLLDARESDLALYKDIASAEEERLAIGPWGDAWGPPDNTGIVKTSLTFLGGGPGRGKSSLMLALARTVAETVGPALYVVKEENREQVKSRGIRLGIPEDAPIHIVSRFQGTIPDLCEQIRPKIVILDSLPALVGLGWNDVKAAEEVLQGLKDYATEHECPALVIDHVNREGEFSGPIALEHLVDTTIFAELETKSDIRFLMTMKNRHGPAGIFVRYAVGAHGCEWLPPIEENDDPSEDPDAPAV